MTSHESTLSHPSSGGGVSRVLAKLQKSVEEGDYYEAHQMYRTVCSRYIAQKNPQDAYELVYAGALLFFEYKQVGSGSDLALLLLETLSSFPSPPANALERIVELFHLYPHDYPNRETFMIRAVKWSAATGLNTRGDPSLHHVFGSALWRDHKFAEAEKHFLLGTETSFTSMVDMLIEWSQAVNETELDLLITRTVLHFLVLKNLRAANLVFSSFTAKHPAIRNPPYSLPLLNFCHFLLLTLERDAGPFFSVLRDKYKPSLQRDPEFSSLLDEIGKAFFNIQPREGTGMLSQVFQMLGGGGPSQS